jgi:hypothetical protein
MWHRTLITLLFIGTCLWATTWSDDQAIRFMLGMCFMDLTMRLMNRVWKVER